MNPILTTLLEDFAVCTRLCLELQAVLNAERSALVTFNMAELAEATMRKEQLGRALGVRRKRMRDLVVRQWGNLSDDAIAGRLPDDERAQWESQRSAWLAAWDQVHRTCDQNQRLLKHSLRNLGMLVENFKRLIGEKPTYSAKGMRVDTPFEGKVIEGRF